MNESRNNLTKESKTMKIEHIEVDLNSVNSIVKAERKKSRLEKDGYSYVECLVGTSMAIYTYKKG